MSPCRALCCPGSLGARAVRSDQGRGREVSRHPFPFSSHPPAIQDGFLFSALAGSGRSEDLRDLGIGFRSAGLVSLPAFDFPVEKGEMACKGSLWSRPCPHTGLETLRLHHSRDLQPPPHESENPARKRSPICFLLSKSLRLQEKSPRLLISVQSAVPLPL